MTRWRVGIVGCGVMGARHARVFASLEKDFQMVGAFDPREDAIPPFLRRFVNETALVDASDLVVVANPIDAHREAASRAIARHRHVLVEKPIAAKWREASALVGRATVADVHLFVGHSERFHPVTRALAAELRGARIRSMHFRRVASGAPRDASLRDSRADALLNLAVHDIDLAAHLGNARVELSSAQERGGICSVELVSQEGWRATIDAGRVAENSERTLMIETETAIYKGDLRAGSLLATDRATLAERSIALLVEEPLSAQAAAIARALRGETQTVADGSDGARAVGVAEAALTRLDARDRAAEKL